MAKMRRTRFVGIAARLEAGVDVVRGKPGFGGGVMFGVSWARPAHRIEPPEV
ncbi:MAG: hypothetical protein R3F59_00555 [Myxococcota bacterium]